MALVFDSSAMLALLRAEPEAELVQGLLDDADVPKYAHAINLCEVLYDTLKNHSAEVAAEAIDSLFGEGIEERNDMDGEFWRDVAFLIATRRGQPADPTKTNHKPSLALGDAIGLALARRLDAEFVTKDRSEIAPMEAAGFCRVLFIR
jgi:PIN domain nuclease of toxin-antitoxin system